MAWTRESAVRLSLRENSAGQGLMLMTLAMLSLGVVMVHSALASVGASVDGSLEGEAKSAAWYARADFRHTIFVAAAVVAMATLWRFDYRRLIKGRFLPTLPAALLAISLVTGVLVFIPGVGHSVGGDARWIRIGPPRYAIGFQPSELIKLTLVIFLAAWLSRDEVNPRSFLRTFLPAVLLIGLAAAIVITQDFGTAVIIGASSCAVLLLAGVPWYYLLTLIPPAAAASYVLVYKTPHRWIRITAMMDIWSLTNPSSYQPRQSLLAILTGGWFGKGAGNGLQKLGFLPEDSTDFIFSVYCEEFGFIGAVLLMSLVIVWIWQARRAAVAAGDDFGRLLAGSLGFLVAVQAVLHFAVDTGFAPPTGASMPFISAGGTALVLLAAAVALMISVTAYRGAGPPKTGKA